MKYLKPVIKPVKEIQIIPTACKTFSCKKGFECDSYSCKSSFTCKGW